MNKRINRKGFTLVELLTVVAILGILMGIAIPAVGNLVKKSKEEHDKSIIKTVLMATKSYVQDNKKDAPKYIGAKELVKLETLKTNNYLKEDIKDSNKKDCMKESYVEVFKKDTRNYEYIPYLNCEGDEKVSNAPKAPGINIFLSDSAGKEVASTEAEENMPISNIRIVMVGEGKDGESIKACNDSIEGLGLVGYSIFVYKYNNINKNKIDENDYVEIYNSGSKRAIGKKCLTIGIDLAEYIDVTQRNKLRIVVRANNEKGGEKIYEYKQVFDSGKPGEGKLECGKIYWAPKDNEWSSKRERTVGVECIDKGGSGCQKTTFVKTFTEEMKKGSIYIKDNRGNKKECKVNVNLDWTRPKVTIKAYKIKENGDKGTKVASIPNDDESDNEKVYNLKEYKYGHGDDSWLNKTNYPYGITYSLTVEDKFLDESTWNYNAGGLKKNSEDVKKLTNKPATKYNKKKATVSLKFTKDGYRYGVFTVKDEAGHKTTVNITAPLDRKAPSGPIVNLYVKRNETNLNKDSNVSNLSKYKADTWIKKWVFTKVSDSTDEVSGIDYYDRTVSGKSTNVTKDKGKIKNINAEGISKIFYRVVDNAGNVSKSDTYKIKLDRTKPTCTNVVKKINASGENYSSGSWYNSNVYTAATCSDNGEDASGCQSVKKVTTTGDTGSVEKKEIANYTVTQEGTSTTKWYVYDKAGNAKSCDKITEKIDKTPPTMSWSPDGGTHDNSNGIDVTAKCEDRGPSGLMIGNQIFHINSPSQGAVISHKCVDNAGNEAADSRTFNVRVHSQSSKCGTSTSTDTVACNIKMYDFCNYPQYADIRRKYQDAGNNLSGACSASSVNKDSNAMFQGRYCTKTTTSNKSCWHY